MTLTPCEIQLIAAEVVKQLKPLLGKQQQELTIGQAAELLNVSKPTIERWIRDGRIPSYLVGRCRRLSREAVLNAIQEKSEHARIDESP